MEKPGKVFAAVRVQYGDVDIVLARELDLNRLGMGQKGFRRYMGTEGFGQKPSYLADPEARNI